MKRWFIIVFCLLLSTAVLLSSDITVCSSEGLNAKTGDGKGNDLTDQVMTSNIGNLSSPPVWTMSDTTGGLNIPNIVDKPPVECQFFHEAQFEQAIKTATTYSNDLSEFYGGILPHHLLASEMIASFWKTMSLQEWELIILVGPDHFRKGNTNVTTITTDFSTKNDLTAVDKQIANSLIVQNIASDNALVMQNDHSITAHIPFIAHYMPDTPVLPLLINGGTHVKEAIYLSDYVMQMAKDKKVLVIASIDFSHYLPLEKANEMDIITENAVRQFDIEAIAKMTNDHLDSRPSMIFLLNAMNKLGAKHIETWAHSNSDVIAHQKTGVTTSYFEFGFFK